MDYSGMTEFSCLFEAHRKARKGKRNRNDVVRFEMDLGLELMRLQEELRKGYYRPKAYDTFIIHDPKERTIHTLKYRDRVVQHTLCDNVIEPCMERHLIYDNAASRIGKGTHFAMGRLEQFLRSHYRHHGTKGFILKYDIRKYYDSMDHEILSRLFEEAFPDKRIQNLIRLFIDSYHIEPGKGIPLGNQTSSWFALYYLDGLDRLIKEKYRIKYYSRYMDDGILIHEDRDYLKECLMGMKGYVEQKRKINFNEKTQIMPLSQGVDYLGFHFYLTETGKVVKKLRDSNKRRMKRKVKRYRHAYRKGIMKEEDVKRSLVSYMGHLSHGDTWKLRQHILSHLVLSKETYEGREAHEEKIKAYLDGSFKGKLSNQEDNGSMPGSHPDYDQPAGEPAEGSRDQDGSERGDHTG